MLYNVCEMKECRGRPTSTAPAATLEFPGLLLIDQFFIQIFYLVYTLFCIIAFKTLRHPFLSPRFLQTLALGSFGMMGFFPHFHSSSSFFHSSYKFPQRPCSQGQQALVENSRPRHMASPHPNEPVSYFRGWSVSSPL